MDALVPAFIAAMLCEIGGRVPWLAAILSDRTRAPGAVLAGGLLALAGIASIAAIGGAIVAPMMTPNARAMLLGLALMFAAAGALWRVKPPDPLTGWRIGAFASALFGLFILGFGEGLQFLAFAFAARGPSPLFAAIGSVTGAMVPLGVAVTLGEQGWRALPLGALRMVAGVLFLVAGLWQLFWAWRLLG